MKIFYAALATVAFIPTDSFVSALPLTFSGLRHELATNVKLLAPHYNRSPFCQGQGHTSKRVAESTHLSDQDYETRLYGLAAWDTLREERLYYEDLTYPPRGRRQEGTRGWYKGKPGTWQQDDCIELGYDPSLGYAPTVNVGKA